MQRFINPEELNTLLAKENGPFLFVLVDKKSAFFKQDKTLAELLNRFEERLRILLLDIEYQNVVTEKFKVHGFPAFIFYDHGKRKDVLLGTPDPGVLREFVANNLSDGSIGKEDFSALSLKKGGEMKEKSILAITLTALSMFGLRSALPEISSAALAKFNTIYASFANSELIASMVDSIRLLVS
jgi:hypothetical protein